MKKSSCALKYFTASAIVIALAGCNDSDSVTEQAADTPPVSTPAPTPGWTLAWSDEFDGSSIDDSKWTHEVNCDGGGNNEAQCYTAEAENSFVTDGMLNIVALNAAAGADKPFTSARLVTKDKADFKYGRFEMRAKLPSGQGSWPAFWLLPTDNVYGTWPLSGEIDVMEAVNLKVTDADGIEEAHLHGTLHYGRPWPNNEYSGKEYLLDNNANPADDFHTYAVEWQEGEIRWYVDDYLYATQRKTQVVYNEDEQAVGLAHKGWFTEVLDTATGDRNVVLGNEPFDQKFHILINFAVGGNWPEAVNQTGIDASAFNENNAYQIDYVRVYQCEADLETGAGCETLRDGYDSLDDALVEGKAPAPIAPSDGIARDLAIFDGSANPDWPAWDCCGGSTPELVDDADKGAVYKFMVGAEPTVNGFISRAEFITDPQGVASPFDASPLVSSGTLSFDLKVVSQPIDASSTWLVKVESNGGATAVELALTASQEGAAPVAGQWQTYTFALSDLAAAGLDLNGIDVVMFFPAWGTGEGAEYLVGNVNIADAEATTEPVSLTIFADDINPNWPLWDCCGGTSPETVSDDAEHGVVSQFSIGATPTVMGFINRPEFGGSGLPFDASSLLDNGVLQFDLKIVNATQNATTPWMLKVESNNAATAVELELTSSNEGMAPTTEWQTFTYGIQGLAEAGLDVSAIDVVMVFPKWGEGEGAVYRIDNVTMSEANE
ncbi:glycoside hydrolase family 16 protein [Shewanella waksmanii]|uniref:family 16 glycosylhydrolase n=1 Tax=Shewanella waksmanii TaxID=213783 RepID=UPI0004B64BEB|nr:glycoside hydrolase family 16 protein [Shewanella waksmanii]